MCNFPWRWHNKDSYRLSFMDNEFLIIQPSPSALVQSLRDIGYSMESAVADIIDNSITAESSNVYINFSWNKGFPWLAITDDGCGMTSAELTKAMQLGSRSPLEKRDDKDLGRFGLGLKTAAFSQARQLTLISKKNGDISCREWDLDTIDDDPDSGWKLHVLNGDQIQELPYIEQLLGIIKSSGTIVLLRKMDRYDGLEKKLNQQVDDTRRHLELVFHRYLSPSRGRKKLNIQLNGNQLQGFNPYNPGNNATQELSGMVIHVENHPILVQPYVLPHYNKTTREEYDKYAGQGGYLQNQGFYVYRNRRLIIKGTWFRLIKKEELTKLIRVQIDLPNNLDHLWKIDVKKSHASPPESIRSQLRNVIDRIAASGKKVYRQRGERLRTNVTVPGWIRTASEGTIQYTINHEHPLAVEVKKNIPVEHHRLFNSFLGMLENSFPAEIFYSDIAKEPDALKKSGFDKAQISDLLDLFIGQLTTSGIPELDIPSKLLSIDPFASCAEDVKTLLTEKGFNCD